MRVPEPEALYHYTCEHAHAMLGAGGELLPATALGVEGPHGQTALPQWGALIWLTDIAEPLRGPLGLTNAYASCDRLAYRYRVVDAEGLPSWVWWPLCRRMFPPAMRYALESAPLARPAHWWVSAEPVVVDLDPSWRGSLVSN